MNRYEFIIPEKKISDFGLWKNKNLDTKDKHLYLNVESMCGANFTGWANSDLIGLYGTNNSVEFSYPVEYVREHYCRYNPNKRLQN